VVVGGQASEWSDFLSDVPQGTILGPVLFELHINDTDDTINSKILKFADDTKIYNRIDPVEGIDRMQADLRNLVVYSVVTDSEFASESANFSTVHPNTNPWIFGGCK